MPGPFHRPKGRPFATTPLPIARLPFNLKRDHLYPGRPAVVGRAIQDWQRHMDGEPMPVLLPQRMGFQQWKTGPDQVRRPWWSSAMSFMGVQARYQSGVPNRVARLSRPQPTYDNVTAAYAHGGGALYAPATEAPPVIVRSASPKQNAMLAMGKTYAERQVPIQAFIAAEGVVRARNARNTFEKKRRALESVRRTVVLKRNVAS